MKHEDDAGEYKREVKLDWGKIRRNTEDGIKAGAADRKKKPLSKAEVEAKLAAEEASQREDKNTHEISNRELKRQREHRRIHRGEQFEADGGSTAANGKVVKKRFINAEDKQLKKALGDDRMKAMCSLRSAYKMIEAGMGMQTFNPFRQPGGGGDVEAGAKLMDFYWSWAVDVQKARLSHAMCIETVVFGKSLAEVQSENRRGRLAVKENLIACLDLAVKLGVLRIGKKED
ncbi:MAG: hypothetical protein ACAH80_18685 [Alphaproteobacteria bacterium]